MLPQPKITISNRNSWGEVSLVMAIVRSLAYADDAGAQAAQDSTRDPKKKLSCCPAPPLPRERESSIIIALSFPRPWT